MPSCDRRGSKAQGRPSLRADGSAAVGRQSEQGCHEELVRRVSDTAGLGPMAQALRLWYGSSDIRESHE